MTGLRLRAATPVLGLWKLDPLGEVPVALDGVSPCFVARTASELSIVARIEFEAELGASAGRFRLLSIDATFGTTESGIFVQLANPLAEAGCWILPLGTHDTDHVLLREDQFERAVVALRAAGHVVVP